MSTKKGPILKGKESSKQLFSGDMLVLGGKDLRYNLWRKLSPEASTNPTKPCVTFLT